MKIHYLMMKNDLNLMLEHITLQQVESYGIPAYFICKEADPCDMPSILNFFEIVINYIKMTEIMKK